MSKTKVVPHKYGKHELFAVFAVDENGEPSEKPIVSFGVKKAKAVLEHVDELKYFMEKHGGE